MKLRYFFFALLTIATAYTVSAQTLTATSLASKARSARSIANDLRHKKVQRAAATALRDKDVQSRVRLSKEQQARITDTNVRTTVSQTRADIRRDPVAFGTKAAKEVRKHKKKGLWWTHKKKKRSSTKR